MIKKVILLIIFLYRRVISPFKGETCCRFFPTCSEYSYISISQFGIFKGCLKSIKRIFSCHPFNPGGVDFP